jgi:metal-dependent amidase/aminoacylase/carboxypeptidase family protein
LSAIAFQRETFKDEDHVRIHSIITKGGNTVNVVPDKVSVETQVRARTMAAMLDAVHKVNRAFYGATQAIGAKVKHKDFAGYLPTLEETVSKSLIDAGRIVATSKISVNTIDEKIHNSASTDIGDLTHIMPVLGFTTGGFKGPLHSDDFEIIDKYKAYVLPAKIMALSVYNLLKEDAIEAKAVIDSFPQHLTKQEYLEYMDSVSHENKNN